MPNRIQTELTQTIQMVSINSPLLKIIFEGDKLIWWKNQLTRYLHIILFNGQTVICLYDKII